MASPPYPANPANPADPHRAATSPPHHHPRRTTAPPRHRTTTKADEGVARREESAGGDNDGAEKHKTDSGYGEETVARAASVGAEPGLVGSGAEGGKLSELGSPLGSPSPLSPKIRWVALAFFLNTMVS